MPHSADPGADRNRLRPDHARRTPVQEVAAEFHGDGKPGACASWIFARPGTTRVSLSGAPGKTRRTTISRPRSGRIHRSGRADHLAAGPQRSCLSQPEAAAAARRCHIAPNGFSLDGMKAETRWRRGGRTDRGSHRQPTAAAGRGRPQGGAARSRCRYGAGALAGGTAGRMAGRGAAVARRRPRHIGWAGVAAAGRKLGYSPKASRSSN